MTGASKPRTPSLQFGERIGGRYQVMALVGAGGMGEVYEVLHINMSRRMALKILHLRHLEDPQKFLRLLNEATVTAQIQHDNVIECTDCGYADDGRPWLVMPLLHGSTLRRLIDMGPLPVAYVCDYGVQIAAGLHAAHKRGIVHRDIKPENVFVLEDGRIKVVDFGLMKAVHAGEVITPDEGVRIGTPRYMAPEQFQGHAVDARTDVCALAYVLTEAILGRPLHGGRAPGATGLEPIPLPDLIPGFPARTWKVIERGMARDPRDRYASAREFGFSLAAEQKYLEQHFALDSFEVRLGRRIFMPPVNRSLELPPVTLQKDPALLEFPSHLFEGEGEHPSTVEALTTTQQNASGVDARWPGYPRGMRDESAPSTPPSPPVIDDPNAEPPSTPSPRSSLPVEADRSRVTVPYGSVVALPARAQPALRRDTSSSGSSSDDHSRTRRRQSSTPSALELAPTALDVHAAKSTSSRQPDPPANRTIEPLTADPTLVESQLWWQRSAKRPARQVGRLGVLAILVASSAAATVGLTVLKPRTAPPPAAPTAVEVIDVPVPSPAAVARHEDQPQLLLAAPAEAPIAATPAASSSATPIAQAAPQARPGPIKVLHQLPTARPTTEPPAKPNRPREYLPSGSGL